MDQKEYEKELSRLRAREDFLDKLKKAKKLRYRMCYIIGCDEKAKYQCDSCGNYVCKKHTKVRRAWLTFSKTPKTKSKLCSKCVEDKKQQK